MSGSQDEDSGLEDCIDDLPPSLSTESTHDPSNPAANDTNQQSLPKAKRVACVLCRKRKLRCDGVRPACATCKRLQRDCVYDEVRRKSGPRRGYVKALEARLAQVETLLKTQDDPTENAETQIPIRGAPTRVGFADGDGGHDVLGAEYGPGAHPMLRGMGDMNDAFGTGLGMGLPQQQQPVPETMSWEMIGLGLDEPLPLPDVVAELNQIYFEKVHPTMPMMHRTRYYAAMNLAPHVRPAVCLRYAMWAAAAKISDKYESLHEHFYSRARKYIQQDEMKGHGEPMITVAHCQTWVLLCTYEFKLMYFPRAWMSAGRACRMAQMMGTHRLDGAGLDVKQCLPPPKDLTELEERRRTFWACFCVDRYSSIGTGWPMTIEEVDIFTNLPVDEEAYEAGQLRKAVTLKEVFEPGGVPELHPFSAVILLGALFGRNLLHLHRPSPDDQEDNLNGGFWRRHRHLDNILLNTALALPTHLRLPLGINNPNTVFLNMNIHTSTICLHQAAIFKADKNRMPSRISAESKMRCISAASEIAGVMRQICHLDLSTLNPFVSFCLYVAARVFVQYLKSRPKDASIHSSLQFLLTAMHAIKIKNPLTESFLAQLDVDLESAGLDEHRAIHANLQQSTGHIGQRPECPTKQLGLGDLGPAPAKVPTYGDNGAARFNDPSGHTKNSYDEVGRINVGGVYDSAIDGVFTSVSYQGPTQQRTPGSAPRSMSNPEVMELSPDASGDQQTPSSMQNLSSHTSHTGYSPQDYSTSMNGLDGAGQFGVNSSYGVSTTDGYSSSYGLASFELQDTNANTGFILPQEWSGSISNLSSGLTPASLGQGLSPGMQTTHLGANGLNGGLNHGTINRIGSTGLTPAPGVDGYNDLGMLSDAEWSEVMGTTQGWDSAVFAENLSMAQVLSLTGKKGL